MTFEEKQKLWAERLQSMLDHPPGSEIELSAYALAIMAEGLRIAHDDPVVSYEIVLKGEHTTTIRKDKDKEEAS